MARDHIAVNPLGFFREELDKGSAIGNLALGFRQWLTLLGGQDRGQIILICHHQIKPTTQDRTPLLAGHSRPFLLSDLGLGYRFRHLRDRTVRHIGQNVSPRRIGHFECLITIDPLTGQIRLFRQK